MVRDRKREVSMIQNTPRRPDPERPVFVLPYTCRDDSRMGRVFLIGAVSIGEPAPQLLLAREMMKDKEKSE